MNITITAETGDVLGRLSDLGRGAPLALSRALNRTGGQARTVLVRGLAAETSLTQARIRKNVPLVSATRDNPVATLKVLGRPIPLIMLGARGPEPSRGQGGGVTYRFGGVSGRLPHAFIATMRSGHRAVWQRAGTKRLPIAQEFGPALPEFAEKPEMIQAVTAKAVEAFPVALDHEIRYLMQQSGFGG